MAEQVDVVSTPQPPVVATTDPALAAVVPVPEVLPAAAPPTSESLDKLRVSIAQVIQRYFQPLFLLTLGCVLFLFAIIAFGLFQESAINVMALAASVQVAFGMIIGFVCVYIGLMMTWFGIDAAYTFQGSLDAAGVKGEGALKSASPGLLFALGGMLLIAVSLYKPIVFQEKGGLPTAIGQFAPPDDGPGDATPLTPAPPPPRPPRAGK